MVRKVLKSKNKDSSRLLIFIVIILAVCGISYGVYVYQQNNGTKIDNAYTVTGVVTGRSGGLADAGNFLTVGGERISTGGGALTDNPPKYVSDISTIHVGDRVEVRYVKDKNGHASTDCASCYVKKL